ncbi:MAG: Eco57I restriction-modification methylase domain-containing protein, partial [Candidatus Cloacimonetes bacterium]|nr:Eco57I restriction-modification methylase domain-containing protein [Candidatus Cloacimonadota bacterium]
MTKEELKSNIENNLKGFIHTNSLTEQAINLFKILGYHTDRRIELANHDKADFREDYINNSPNNFNETTAKINDWDYIDMMFQITTEDLSNQITIFQDNEVKNQIIESYLFFILELNGNEYSRTDLAKISREINKLFAMPVMLLIKYDNKLTLSVINRRLNKKDESKDVLEKVTLIKDINLEKPHRAHIDILSELSLTALNAHNFIELHREWQRVLDIKELNNKFYKELANWYFWAVDQVKFPDDARGDKDLNTYNSENVIRMLTRIIFIWFLKEKGLIPEKIFDKNEVNKLIKNFNTPGSKVYYRAILQNLFFATLNQEIENRKFVTEGSFNENKKEHMVKNLYRYKNEFLIDESEIKELFNIIPFLNGGLFECLDKIKENENEKARYQDGFTRNSQKQAEIPDELFFGAEKIIDLSKIYADNKRKNEKVKGLIDILNHYKFTIAESTPIEEEIALDPELLGRVFENLLASYNPETQTTARNQTGSFYTPREIVDYMVDESIKKYLKTELSKKSNMPIQDIEKELEKLFNYSEEKLDFDEEDTKRLINALDSCKILDPACGSGAFPMGILHKMVYLLSKLDPYNKEWIDIQRQKAIKETEIAFQIGDKDERDTRLREISDVFEHNSNDYGRKLYLIENCIYGVDIQPIAIQISKLRFFISLIVDQHLRKDQPNFGVIPLPNLETKFVSANTLVNLKNKDEQLTIFHSDSYDEIIKIENEIKEIRQKNFFANNSIKKNRLKKQERAKRTELKNKLIEFGYDERVSCHISAWDPYNHNALSNWFDPEWMFCYKEGFDIVIGNPPYIQLQKFKGQAIQKTYKEQNYQSYDSMGDIYGLFYERGLDLLKNKGHLCYITSNK